MKNRITDLMAQSMNQISHAIDNEDVEREKQSWMSFFEVLGVFSPEQIEEGMGVASWEIWQHSGHCSLYGTSDEVWIQSIP